MATTKKSRRAFLAHSAIGLGSAWVTTHWQAILEAGEFAQRAGTAGPGQKTFAVFTSDQAVEIDAITSQIIPTDDLPGAHEAHIVNFIDRALVTFARPSRYQYMQGLTDVGTKVREMFPGTTRFSALSSAQQIQLLIAIENTPFFKTIRDHTVIGMFASPQWGGNYTKVGWKLIDYQDTLNFKPPFGYYDASQKPGR
jgi:hypothetical protein